jgi:hypothetical protein
MDHSSDSLIYIALVDGKIHLWKASEVIELSPYIELLVIYFVEIFSVP